MLPIREFDQRIGLTEQFAAALERSCGHQPSVAHTLSEMVRMRVFGILADYPDQNDHDVLRSDPVFKIVAGRSPEGDDLASQPTLSRFENAIDVKSLGRGLQDVLVDQFIASFDEPPTRITLDIDPFDDPTHGRAATDLLPRLLRSVPIPAASDHLCRERSGGHALPVVRHGPRGTGGRRRLWSIWWADYATPFPACGSCLRADSGFGVPKMYVGV